MSDSLATYTFLPWLRQGISNKIVSDPTSKARATVQVKLKIKGRALSGSDPESIVSRKIELYGPGDIIGIDKNAIVKNEPRNWMTNFESNYMPYIEFYDEDFPWRYSPSVVDNDRLRPWLALVILKESEFKEGKNIKNKPLAYIDVPNAEEVFQPYDQLWAWAHVHVNESIISDKNTIVSSNEDEIIGKLKAVLKKDPDLAYSRIMCPRKLEPNTSYHAFLISAFETGRLAGLGLDPSKTPKTEAGAWQNYSGRKETTLYPIYHRWFFKTGSLGDFEYLVRLLKPQPMDNRVGTRDMDVQQPGVNVHGIDNPDLNGFLKLGGALRIPFISMSTKDKAIFKKYDEWAKTSNSEPHPFQKDLASLINLADDYEYKSSDQANAEADLDLDPTTNDDDKDPLITAPLYGRWHALTQRLLNDRKGDPTPNKTNWIHELNLDPRYRTHAGFGTGVIQKNQEDYMEAAWKQVGEIKDANQKIRFGQVAKEISWIWYHKHLGPLVTENPEKAFMLMAPVNSRIVLNEFTVSYTLKESKVPAVIASPEMRRIMRRGSRLMKSLPFDSTITPDNLIDRLNKEEVFPAPPKKAPEKIPTVQNLAELDTSPTKLPGFLQELVAKYPKIKWLFFILAILFLLFSLVGSFFGFVLALIALIFGVLFYLINKYGDKVATGSSLNEDSIQSGLVDDFPKNPDFTITEVGTTPTSSYGTKDSEEGKRFKEGLRDYFELIDKSREAGRIKEKPALDLIGLTTGMYGKINPEKTIPNYIYNIIRIPGRIWMQLPEEFTEVMTYPEIDIPMYKPLTDDAADLFLPNIQFIPNNSISLLETNQKFIESYMMGLNHEFARELLWREYPTDQRGSYFRQFWDASTCMEEEIVTDGTLTVEEQIEKQKEKLRDIPPIHLWSKYSKLGEHDHRALGGDKKEEVVLAIRGDLLKRYPSAVIYAHKAKWHIDKDTSQIDFKVERELEILKGIELKKPPKNKIKTPLYEAKVDPDITFFGFDLSVEEAQGKNGDHPDVDKDFPGWFFVIKERPGEPRFGLDLEPADSNPIDVWNDLSWKKVAPTGGFLDVNTFTPILLKKIADNTPNEKEKLMQNKDDLQVKWNNEMNAAELAYVLYQVPIMVAIHASEMLPKT